MTAASTRHPLRILQVYPKADYYTGAAIQLYELAVALAERGHSVMVATRPSSLWSAKCRQAGIGHFAVPMRSDLDPWSVQDLVRIVRAHGIDVVHAHKGKARTLTLLAGLLAPIPVLVLNRGVSFPLDSWSRLGYVTGAVTAIVAVSESIKDGLVRQGVPSDKIEVIYSGTDTTRFHPGIRREALRAELGLEPSHFLITQVGVRSLKGNDDVLTAMALLLPRVPRARLLLVGANVEKSKTLQARAQRRGLGGAVTILGFRDDVPEILAASDVLVDASYGGLGLTGTLREALAVETPVIATRIEGNPELVLHGETGLLVPPRAPGEIADAIIALAADPVQARRMAAAGRRRVEARFSLQAKAERMEVFYRRLVALADVKPRPDPRGLDGPLTPPAEATVSPGPGSAGVERTARAANVAGWRAAFVGSSVTFLVLALVASLSGIFGWERAVAKSIALLAIPEVGEIFSWVTMLGSRRTLFHLGIFVLMVLPIALLRRWWLWTLVMVACGSLEVITKHLVGRPRPSGSPAGFPSGHTALATAFFLSVAYLTGKGLIDDRAKAAVWSLAILTAAMVGVSRLVLGVHWVLDVIGGVLLGMACAAVAASWNEGHALPPSPFRSVTWMAFRSWVYRWQTVLPLPSFAVLFLTPPGLAEDSLLDSMCDWSGAALIGAGIVLRAWAAGYASGPPWPEPVSPRSFATVGPYAYLRNPTHLANGLIGVGIMVLAENALGLIVVPAVWIAISRLAISREEEILRQHYGEMYADYCRRVPRWLPRLTPAASTSAGRFTWDALRAECPAAVNAILLGYLAETSEYLPHLFG